MPWFPITDLSREHDIRTRRRRALLLLSTLVFVPWIVLGDHGGQRVRPASPPASTRWFPHRVPKTIPAPAQGGMLAETQSFTASSLQIDLPCARSVTVLPDPSLIGRAILSVPGGAQGALDTISISGGSVTQQNGCGDDAPVTIRTSNVMPLTLIQSGGSNTLHAGSFDGAVTITSTGSGDVVMEHAGTLTVNGHNAGDVTIGSVTGPMTATMEGSGDLRVNGGTIPVIEASSHSSASLLLDRVRILGGRITLDGSGDLRLGSATGTLQLQTSGSGDMVVSDVELNRLTVRGDGSGDIVIRAGRIAALDAARDGSGSLSIYATVATGHVDHSGSGDVSIPRADALVRTRSD